MTTRLTKPVPKSVTLVLANTLAMHAGETCQAKLEAALFKALQAEQVPDALALAQHTAKQRIPQRGTACCIGCKADHATHHI